MTTDQMISTFDQADLTRFDDDGGAPTTRLRPQPASTRPRPAEPTSGISEDRLCLSLAPVRGQGSFDGAWWPQTLRLAHELPGLVTALSTADETITRVSVNGDAWTDIPSRLAQPGRPTVRVGCWFRTLDPHVVTVGGGGRPPIRLLVIPPDAAAGPASQVLRLVAAGRLAGPPSQILHDAGAAVAVPSTARIGQLRRAARRPPHQDLS